MSDSDIRIPEKIAPEVFALASQYYADYRQSFSQAELVEAGSEACIPAEFLQRAIQEIEAQRWQKLERHKQVQKRRQLLFKVGVGMLATISLWSIWTRNTLSRTAANVEATWAQVENQLQRRADLIPNLVNITQLYAQHEQTLVTLLLQSRENYQQADTLAEKATAIADVEQAIEHFQEYAMTHPQLHSSQLFINLQYELAGAENRIAVERMRYNQAVQDYNQRVQSFPNSLLARTLGFKKQSFWQATDIVVPVLER